ncbi:TPA: DUF4435 domain-containing protein [Salmonella enterica]|nr:DUF4435 domain-containing protein [Salmonella enterica]
MTMLERSKSAKRAMPIFYQELNDINIYIEDTAHGYDRIYQNILTKLLNDIRIKKIFPIGSRLDVLAKAREDLAKNNSFFIVDGDLYLLGGELYDIPENVFVLERYCIENYLTDRNAFYEIINEELTSFAENSDFIEFDVLMTSLRENLKYLFLLFTLCHTMETGLKNVSHGYRAIIKDELGNIDEEKIKKLTSEIYKNLSEHLTLPYLDYKLNKLTKNIDGNICFALKYISAKDFTLPLLFMKVRNRIPNKINNISLKTRLSRKIDISCMANMRNKVLQRLSIE